MFIGHFGLAFAAKRAAPRSSLATLFSAAASIDLVWPVFLLAGVEHVRIAPGITRLTPLDFYHYPVTHSLLAVAGWSVLFGVGYFLLRRYFRGAIVVGLLVTSHWALDALVHRPDLPLAPGDPTKIGLGLWNHPPVAILLELAIFVAGLIVYLRTTTSQDRIGSAAIWSLAAFLLITWVANLVGPPPPSVNALASVALLAWLLIPWAAWGDRHRTVGKRIQQAFRPFTANGAGI
ncbi:MAG TPA: hypothetical protein VD837_17915 [Terriglobales bacterium]|nr:hypothetical protein [Terriglobales bacterium]